jgi:hypothetical protein
MKVLFFTWIYRTWVIYLEKFWKSNMANLARLPAVVIDNGTG